MLVSKLLTLSLSNGTWSKAVQNVLLEHSKTEGVVGRKLAPVIVIEPIAVASCGAGMLKVKTAVPRLEGVLAVPENNTAEENIIVKSSSTQQGFALLYKRRPATPTTPAPRMAKSQPNAQCGFAIRQTQDGLWGLLYDIA